MAGSSKTTTNHDEIRKWAEARGGKPTTSKTKAHKDETKSSRSSSKAPKASAKSHKE